MAMDSYFCGVVHTVIIRLLRIATMHCTHTLDQDIMANGGERCSKYIHHMSDYSRHLNDKQSSNICSKHTQQKNQCQKN